MNSKLVALLLGSALAGSASADVTFTASGGAGSTSSHGLTQKGPVLDLGLGVGGASGDQDAGWVWYAGAGLRNQPRWPNVAGTDVRYDSCSMCLLGEGVVGYRLGPAALAGVAEYRWLGSTEGEFKYGAGLRLRLGPAGSLTSRMAVSGKYLLGTAQMQDLAQPNDLFGQAQYDAFNIREVRGRLEASIFKDVNIFVEYRNEQYTSTAHERRDSTVIALGVTYILF